MAIQDDTDEALRQIAVARDSGATELDLSELGFERLPENVFSGLTALRQLNLIRCEQLTGLQPLAGLTALRQLNLSGCKQLTELQPLAGLTALQQLNLIRCEQLTGLQPLAGLTALRQLNLSGCKQLTELQPLAGLTALQQLDLSGCKRLTELQPLAGLTALQQLDLSLCEQLTELQPLAGLTALQQLDLSGCKQLTELQPLAGLTALQQLDLSGCEQLTELQPLAGLTALQQLDLSWCKQLTELQPLAGLTALQQLDLSGCKQLTELQPLAGLTALQQLNLIGCEQLTGLQPLAGLTALRQLNLSGCKQLTELQPLAGLTALQQLDLGGCELLTLDCAPHAVPWISWVSLTHLFVDRLLGAPGELRSISPTDNAAPRVRAWEKDLAAGEACASSLKVFVLGNGFVGKTQLCRRLRDEDFDPSVPSTHGIHRGVIQLSKLGRNLPAVDAHLWDFGGQDIYLGTHALFLDAQAIYIVAWNPDYENTDAFEQQGVPMRNRPLAYWLEYVRAHAGPEACVMVVQTQCEREHDVRRAPLPTEHGFERLKEVASCASQDEGVEALQLELRGAARYQLERYGKVRIPANWVAVADTLRARTDEKTLPRSEFDALCLDQHGTAMPAVVLTYLHRSGQVFWREGVFADQVVLDQDWALQGVYAVLERQLVLPELRRQWGRFTPTQLAALAWRQYGEPERELFLWLMEQCQICFKVTGDIYITPALLPDETAMASHSAVVWRDASPDAALELDYAFLHEGVLRALLCGIGMRAGLHAVYWAYGVCFYDAEWRATVHIRSMLSDVASGKAGGKIVVEVAGAGATKLVAELSESIQRIGTNSRPKERWLLGAPSRDQQAQQLGADEAFSTLRPAAAPLAVDALKRVHVSYAWSGDSEALVDAIELNLPADISLVRDRTAMKRGESITRFMMAIGQGERVLVVLSDKYLHSAYCMRELLYLYQACQGDEKRWRERVVSVVADESEISKAAQRRAFARYWQNEHEQLHQLLNEDDIGTISPADREELLAVADFKHRVSEVLAWVADTLRPQGSQQVDQAIQWLQQL